MQVDIELLDSNSEIAVPYWGPKMPNRAVPFIILITFGSTTKTDRKHQFSTVCSIFILLRFCLGKNIVFLAFNTKNTRKVNQVSKALNEWLNKLGKRRRVIGCNPFIRLHNQVIELKSVFRNLYMLLINNDLCCVLEFNLIIKTKISVTIHLVTYSINHPFISYP